jgi:hypothetical protein
MKNLRERIQSLIPHDYFLKLIIIIATFFSGTINSYSQWIYTGSNPEIQNNANTNSVLIGTMPTVPIGAPLADFLYIISNGVEVAGLKRPVINMQYGGLTGLIGLESGATNPGPIKYLTKVPSSTPGDLVVATPLGQGTTQDIIINSRNSGIYDPENGYSNGGKVIVGTMDRENIVILPNGYVGINVPQNTILNNLQGGSIPVAPTQFGDRLTMYYAQQGSGNNHNTSIYHNIYYDGMHKRIIDNAGGGSINFFDDGTLLLGTFCPGPKDGPVPYNGDKLIRMDCNGAVTIGVGHTPDPSFKLWVEGNTAVRGNIRAKEVRVTTTNWPDYVFKKEYNLLSLSEVDSFIQANGHLPGIISAKDAEANGVQVGEMQAKLLEKIEELTLYIIEMKKENQRFQNELKAQNEKLQLLKDHK